MNSSAADTTPAGARLVLLADGQEYQLTDRSIVIGRDAGCDVVIPGRQVSRRHAEVVPTPRGYVLIDTSSNGTLVNDRPVEGRRLLAGGDVIACGPHRIRFTPAEETKSAAPEAAPQGAEQRLSNTMFGIPVVNPPPGAAERLSNTMHGIPAVPPPGAAQRLSNTMHGMPLAPPRLAMLTVRSGPLTGRRFPVYVPVANIGRAEYNDIVLAHDSVSTAHAKLQRREGIWVLQDLDSTNGTMVDGHRVKGETPLAPGAALQVGDVTLLFEPTDDGMPSPSGGGTRVSKGIDDLPGQGSGTGQ